MLFPAIANINDDMERIHTITRRAVQTVAYIMFPLLFGLAAISKNLVLLLFTEKWLPTVVFVQILSIGYAISLIGSVSLQSLKAVGRSDIILKLEFIKKPIYFILLIVGIKISVIAVAVTMAIYNVYGAIVNGGQLKSVIHYSYKEQLEDLLPSLGLSSIMLVAVSSLQNVSENLVISIGFQIIVGVLVYVGLSYLSKHKIFFYIIKSV